MRTLLFAVASIAFTACTVDMSEPEPVYGTTDQKIESLNRLATNRLATNRLATNRLATNRLATNSLSGLVSFSETAEILEDEEGRDVYSYVVGCALPAGTVLNAYGVTTSPTDSTPANDSNGGEVCSDGTCTFVGNYDCNDGHCKFYGSMGLTPRWLDHKLSPPEKGWISACLFARVNAHAIAKGISLRGRHEALATSPDERENFLVEEGAFYGNVFVDDPDPSVMPDWYACSGEGIFNNDDALGLRDCAKPDPDPANAGKTMCGFNYAGECRDFDPTFASKYACRQFDPATTSYSDCHESDGPGQWGGKKKFRYVITSYVGN